MKPQINKTSKVAYKIQVTAWLNSSFFLLSPTTPVRSSRETRPRGWLPYTPQRQSHATCTQRGKLQGRSGFPIPSIFKTI
ncbi:hypothetical protein [Chlorogloeopsis sp. ULAP01]|uniref:hypothetical protein n=1 Tax=Chlorogloeopsis sp. ULAP01 TaxID=3056483 RepID=UPI0025AC15B9|nr:hypothetical protein [Chlorogloeopsis sp. ULAP01]